VLVAYSAGVTKKCAKPLISRRVDELVGELVRELFDVIVVSQLATFVILIEHRCPPFPRFIPFISFSRWLKIRL
jgi:hypothetical protein